MQIRVSFTPEALNAYWVEQGTHYTIRHFPVNTPKLTPEERQLWIDIHGEPGTVSLSCMAAFGPDVLALPALFPNEPGAVNGWVRWECSVLPLEDPFPGNWLVRQYLIAYLTRKATAMLEGSKS